VFVIGDSAYPLLPWVMKPFTQPNVDIAQKRTYNYRKCRGRIVVEIAFGRLKARWRRLIKRNDMVVRKVPNVISAACVLRNMCEICVKYMGTLSMSHGLPQKMITEKPSPWMCPVQLQVLLLSGRP